jgi:hypothetical protein
MSPVGIEAVPGGTRIIPSLSSAFIELETRTIEHGTRMALALLGRCRPAVRGTSLLAAM